MIYWNANLGDLLNLIAEKYPKKMFFPLVVIVLDGYYCCKTVSRRSKIFSSLSIYRSSIRKKQLPNPSTGKPVNILNSFYEVFIFQTDAWERNNAKNVGIFWLALRYIGCYTNPSQ